MKNLLNKIFGGGNEREVRKLKPIIEKINSLEAKISSLDDVALSGKTEEFKKKLSSGANLDDILPEAFAVIREAAKREIGQRHFDVQLIGGVILHKGKIAEMKTGEGKTLVATLPLYLNALEGKGAHLVTVNDYLAKFQGEWMGRIYDRLGMSVGIIQNQGISFIFSRDYKEAEIEGKAKPATPEVSNLRPCTRKEAYGADITYGTNNEFGFDYLRDNMAQDVSHLSQRELNFAIVDEVDSILIDEARTPLIISAPAEESADLYIKFAQIAPRLKKDADYELDEKARAVSLTDSGVAMIEKTLGLGNIYDSGNIALVHHMEEAVKAQVLFKKDRDYTVKDGEVVIVDEFTGRMMPGRRYSEGLHQAIEAKEGVEIKRESDTLATISFQNLFRLYKKLSGMTGTAATEAEELGKIYKLDVVEIPTNQPMIRKDSQDKIYKTEEGKYKAIVEKVKQLNEKGQPVLIGTISISKSEKIAKYLSRSGIPHEVLNAKYHEREAKIIAQAGRFARVTVATNMAGRGVDILLGGSPADETEKKKVIAAGGLYVIGTERHESRRIDNQLRGRAGRQGDPGFSEFYISMEDDLMRIFGGERMKNLMNRLGLPDDQPVEHSLISKSIETAQRRVEGHNFDIRKNLVEYDDVMNKQREVLYRKRRAILEYDQGSKQTWIHDGILEKMTDEEKAELDRKLKNIPEDIYMYAEKRIYMSVIDQFWVEHLNTMEQLRDSIGLRGYGQVDPLVAYKQESYTLFTRLLNSIEDEVINILNKVEFTQAPASPPSPLKDIKYEGAQEEDSSELIGEAISSSSTEVAKVEREVVSKPSSGVVSSVRSVGDKMNAIVQNSQKSVEEEKVGRNDPCPCGSGKKYKKCCGK
jgi:preprotein translocase subunit SecA